MEPRVLAKQRVFLEGLRWRNGRFWASDVYAGKVVAIGLDGATEEIAAAPAVLSGVGWLANGDLLVVSVLEDRVLRLQDSRLLEHANLKGLTVGHPNDMTVDASGRAYVGTMGFDLATETFRPGVVIRIDPNGTAHVAAENLLFPNGIVTLQGGRILIVAESCGQRLTAFDIQPDGSLTNRRLWAQFGQPCSTGYFADFLAIATLAPDGIAADSEGNVWVADPLGCRAVRVATTGEITAERRGQANEGIYSCAVGGHDGRLLGLCAAPSHELAVLTAAPRSRLLAFEV